ncbi:hypothetical protein EST38_g13794, partial [Candolleomyces aberdarensis]
MVSSVNHPSASSIEEATDHTFPNWNFVNAASPAQERAAQQAMDDIVGYHDLHAYLARNPGSLGMSEGHQPSNRYYWLQYDAINQLRTNYQREHAQVYRLAQLKAQVDHELAVAQVQARKTFEEGLEAERRLCLDVPKISRSMKDHQLRVRRETEQAREALSNPPGIYIPPPAVNPL